MDLDPTEVPPFPRWRMELTSDGRALVRGRPVVVPAGEEPRKVAIEAVAQLARDQDLRAVRVEAVGPDGREWPMVVSAVGEHWDLSTSRRTAASGRPAWQLPAAVTAAVAVVVAVVVVAVLAVRRQAGDPAVVASDAAPTAQPTEFPILPPDGWTTRARWATGPLASDDPPARVGPGAVAVLTRDGQVEVRDVETGAVRWTAEAPSGVTGGAHVTVLEQHQVVAVVTDDELVWWPVDGADKPRSLHLPDRTEQVSFAGRSPMAVLPDQHVAVPDVEPTTWKDRVIPAGAVALGNDEGRVIAADRTGHWWAIDTDAQIAPLPHRLSAPGAGQLAGWPATRTASCSLSGSPPTARRSACTTPRGDRRCGQRCRAGTLTPRSPSPPSRTASRWSTTGRSPTPRTVASAACPRAGRPRPSCRTGPTVRSPISGR